MRPMIEALLHEIRVLLEVRWVIAEGPEKSTEALLAMRALCDLRDLLDQGLKMMLADFVRGEEIS